LANKRVLNCSASVTLAMLLFLCMPKSLWATADLEISTTGDPSKTIEVTGGGRTPWKLRYGTAGFSNADRTLLAKVRPGRAYFSHGQYLRSIDTDRGMVLGRWLMPGIVTRIVPKGENGTAEITTEEPFDFPSSSRESSVSTFAFDPLHPDIPPATGCNSMAEGMLPEREAGYLYGAKDMKPDQARALMPEAQEAVRRDPFSPWLGVMLGKLLLATGDPGADAAFAQAIHSTTSFQELIPISGFLENLGSGRIADEAFQRGYQNFLQSGNDPRLVTWLIVRLWMYPVIWEDIPKDRRAAVAERIYQLTPYAEGTELAWQEYAESATTPGRKRLWMNRAEETQKKSGLVSNLLSLQLDIALLVGIACAFTQLVFVLVSYVRYRGQQRYDRATAASRSVGRRNRLAFINLQYWSMPQRIGFVLIFVMAWYCYGWIGQSLAPTFLTEVPMSISSGTLAAPSTRQFLQHRLAATPDRDFLMALSLQQGGDYAAATQLYQRLPQYAESWNNLGTIWRMHGREADAIGAFQKSLQAEPTLAEAAFNLGRPTTNYWTQIHQQYVPNTPMLALPPKRVWVNAYVGSPPLKRLALASLGPLHPWHLDINSMTIATGVTKASYILWAIFATALVLTVWQFAFPRQTVQQPPGIGGKVLGILFPGTAREWGYAGGLVLVVWIFLLLQLILTKWVGSPYIMSDIAVPNLVKAYGIGTSQAERVSLMNPGWTWLYLAPTVLGLLNLMVSFSTIRAKVRQRFAD